MRRLSAKSTIADLVASNEFASLPAQALSVYLVLIDMSSRVKSKRFEISNGAFAHHPTTVRTALSKLASLKLVSVEHDPQRRRFIELI